MTARRLIGWSLVASPMVAIFVLMIVSIGWLQALAIMGGIALLCGVVWFGAELALGLKVDHGQ